MQPKRFVIVILLSFFTSILLTNFYENLSIRNEAIASEQKAQVLLVIRQGLSADTEFMLKAEVDVMTSMLEEAGFTVTVTSISGMPIKGQTLKLKPHLKLADVKINNYVGIIMPCMAKYEAWSEEEVSLVKQAVAQGKPIAAQRNSIIILAEAGARVGKKCTFAYGLRTQARFGGAIYSGKGVIKDGNIITSSHCPYYARYYGGGDDGTSELTKLFIETIKD